MTDADNPDGTKPKKDNNGNTEYDDSTGMPILESIDKDGDAAKVAKCDLDGDGIITVNDWKIAAAKIIVDGSFDADATDPSGKKLVDYSKFSSTSLDTNTAMNDSASGFSAIPAIKASKGPDNIGWQAGQVKDDNNKPFFYQDNGNDSTDLPDCYVQSPKSGDIYELRNAQSDFSATKECPDGYHRACVADQSAQCNVSLPNPAYSLADAAADNSATPPITYSIPTTIPTLEPFIQALTPPTFTVCAVDTAANSENPDTNSSHDGAACSISDLKNFTATVSCSTKGDVPMCLKDDTAKDGGSLSISATDASQNIVGTIVGSDKSNGSLNNGMCNIIATPDKANVGLFVSSTTPLVSQVNEKCATLQNELVNGTKDASGNVVIAANPNLQPKCSFTAGVNVPLADGSTIDMSGAVTGDGTFSLAEKQFWGADPTKVSTNGNGQPDEENIVGLGIDNFSWMYSPGDQVGVVVEGDSTLHSDHPNYSATYKRMWAFSNNTCSVLDKMEAQSSIDNTNPDDNTRGYYMDGNTGSLTATLNLDDCLKDNLLDPSTTTGNDTKLGVQLNSTPDNPTDDPSGAGDTLSVSSSSANTQDQNGLTYNWSVEESRSGSATPIDTTSWVDVTTMMENAGSFSASDITGVGKNSLDINLNLKDDTHPTVPDLTSAFTTSNSYNGVFYLRVKLTIKGTNADGGQNAQGVTLPIRVKMQENSVHAYPVSANSDGTVKLVLAPSGQSSELCVDGQGKPITPCYVTKNEIVGVTVAGSNLGTGSTALSWTINGNATSCSTSVSQDCKGGNTLIFPILGNVGETVDVVASGVDKNNESIQVSKSFVIGDSQLAITSGDAKSVCDQQCLSNNASDTNIMCPKYLGHYNNVDGTQTPDCSNQVWETNPGKTVTLSAAGQTGFDWSIDGQILPQDQDLQQITLPINKNPGDNYNIGLTTHMTANDTTQLGYMRKALSLNWGVAPTDELVDENQSVNIELDVVGGGSQVASTSPTTFGASLITHLPEQFMFLLKIALTGITLLLVASLLFAIMPETLPRRE